VNRELFSNKLEKGYDASVDWTGWEGWQRHLSGSNKLGRVASGILDASPQWLRARPRWGSLASTQDFYMATQRGRARSHCWEASKFPLAPFPACSNHWGVL